MHARSTIIWLVSAALILVGPVAAQQSSSGLGEHQVSVSKNVMVPMRDGVRLATDIYFPAGDSGVLPGTFPVLLTRTPYGKNGAASTAEFFASHGYIVAAQDVRGRYESEGTFYIYLNEPKDGYDAVEWLAAQPWSNGDIGTYGPSYLAATQNALAIERPPHLRAMFVQVGTSNYFEDGAGSGGAAYLLHNVAYAFNLAMTGKEAAADPARRRSLEYARTAEGLGEWLRAYPYRNNASPFEIAPSYQTWFAEWMEHPTYDEYWQQNGYTFERYYDDYPDIPVYFVGGWYDIFLRGTLNNYIGLSSRNSSPTKLLIGPWVHGVGPDNAGDVYFGSSAAVDIRNEQLRWFDAVLRKRDTGILSEPPVRLFVMGGGKGEKTIDGQLDHGGEWIAVQDWPAGTEIAIEYYLHPDGSLSTELPSNAPPSSYTYDPSDPVPTIGGKIDSGGQLVPGGPFDQRCIAGKVFGCEDNLPLSARRDVLVFQTPPLAEDVVINGPLTVKLWASSSAVDTDFTAKLVDVYPPSEDYPHGYDLLIADRIVRARHRDGLEESKLMEPGEIYEFTIDLLGVANRFKAGHRIRLDISSSNFPFFDVNPNTGERVGHHVRMAPAVNTIYHDRGRPSHIVLPIVRSGSNGTGD